MIILRQLAIAGAAVIIAVTICYFAGHEIARISGGLQEKENLSKLLALRIENIRRLKNSLALMGENDKKIIAVYPSTDDILDYVGALESIAKVTSLKQHLSFGDFLPVTAAGGISIFRTDYSITLNGTVTTLKSYLEQLEKVSFITKIGAVNLLASPPNGWNGDSSVTINGSLYAQQTQ